MIKIDCITDMCEEQYTAGLMTVAKNMLNMGAPIDCIAECTELPIEKINELQKEIQFNAGLMTVAKNMLTKGFTIEDICECSELPIETINELQKEISSNDY